MNRNCANGILLLAAMALPASAGEIYAFDAANYAIGTDVSSAVSGVAIRRVSSFGASPSNVVVEDPNSLSLEAIVPVDRWLNGGAAAFTCNPPEVLLPGGEGGTYLEIQFEQPIQQFQIVAYSSSAPSHVGVCSADRSLELILPVIVAPPFEIEARRSFLHTAELTLPQPLDRLFIGSVSGFGVSAFRAEGVSFVDEPITGALMLGWLAALAGLRRRTA
jgi:hypothetical protein